MVQGTHQLPIMRQLQLSYDYKDFETFNIHSNFKSESCMQILKRETSYLSLKKANLGLKWWNLEIVKTTLKRNERLTSQTYARALDKQSLSLILLSLKRREPSPSSNVSSQVEFQTWQALVEYTHNGDKTFITRQGCRMRDILHPFLNHSLFSFSFFLHFVHVYIYLSMKSILGILQSSDPNIKGNCKIITYKKHPSITPPTISSSSTWKETLAIRHLSILLHNPTSKPWPCYQRPIGPPPCHDGAIKPVFNNQ